MNNTESMNAKKVLYDLPCSLKVLKLYAWEPYFQAKVTSIREEELFVITKSAVVITISYIVSFSSNLVVRVYHTTNVPCTILRALLSVFCPLSESPSDRPLNSTWRSGASLKHKVGFLKIGF